jgi:acyl-coenzyme A synthetase/AMP-(fatty) acid ligase
MTLIPVQVADKISALLLKKGIQSGDFVAVFMSNSPEMVFTVLALSNIGAVPSFINTALRGIVS